MDHEFRENALLFKALADANRVTIVGMLSGGELCACKILEKLGITQPTLSHHMKMLCGCGLVNSRKDGKWTYYSLNHKAAQRAIDFLVDISASKNDCLGAGERCNCHES